VPCPTFVFNKLDELTLGATLLAPTKGRSADLAPSTVDVAALVSAALASFALRVELWSAEQLVADEPLGAATVPLADLVAVDFSDRFDKSQPRVEEEASAVSTVAAVGGSGADSGFAWRKLLAAPGMYSALLDPAVSAHAAVSVAVKLVACRRPVFHVASPTEAREATTEAARQRE
jgi:hypothetical protein